tara:strand:+ start:539 stop:745 length:207 start_codon:yes stop_codon:yes gene_type:complete
MNLNYHYNTQNGSIEVLGHYDEGIIITDVLAHEGVITVNITEFIYNNTEMLNEMTERLAEEFVEKKHK